MGPESTKTPYGQKTQGKERREIAKERQFAGLEWRLGTKALQALLEAEHFIAWLSPLQTQNLIY